MSSIVFHRENNLQTLSSSPLSLKRKEDRAPSERASKKAKNELDSTPLKETPLNTLKICPLDLSPYNKSSLYSEDTLHLLIQSASDLKEITLRSISLNHKSIQALKEKASQLQKLDTNVHELTPEDLYEIISQAARMRILTLSLSEVDGQCINALANCSHLKELTIKYSDNLNDAALKMLAENCPHLELLNLDGCENYTDEGLFYLAKQTDGMMRTLKKLNLGRSPYITDKGIEAIAKAAKNLEELDLSYSKLISDCSIHAITSLGKLESLSLTDCRKVTDEAFLHLVKNHFPAIRRLNVSGTSITNQTIEKLEQIKSLRNLQTLSLNDCQIDKESLKRLPSFSNLKRLEISCVKLNAWTRLGLSYLKECKKLTQLRLGYYVTANEIIDLVEKMPQLKKLYVSSIEETFGHATAQPKHFKKLNISNPNLEIIYGGIGS